MPSSSRSRNPFVHAIVLVLGVARRERFRVALIGGFALPFHGIQRATGDVDFLAEARGSPALHDALLAAGARCLHRGTDAANYARGTSRLSPVDFIFARRERALDMLRRAGNRLLRGARLRVPVVDAEALIGLKLQALVNAPSRRAREEADIQALFAAHRGSLNADLLRDYFVKRPADFIIGAEVPDQASLRVPQRVRDLDEFLAFLAQLEAVFGPIERRRQVTTGDHFLL